MDDITLLRILLPLVAILFSVIVIVLKIKENVKKIIIMLPSILFIVSLIIMIWYIPLVKILPVIPNRIIFWFLTYATAEVAIISLIIYYAYLKLKVKKEKNK